MSPRILVRARMFSNFCVVCPVATNQVMPDPSEIEPGSRIDTCLDCLRRVWVTPNATLDALALPVVCLPCLGDAFVAKRAYFGRPPPVGPPPADIVDALSRKLGVQATAEDAYLIDRMLEKATRKRLREELRAERRKERRGK